MYPITESPIVLPSLGIWIEKAVVLALGFPEIGGRIQVYQGNPSGHDRVYQQDLIQPSRVDPDCQSLSGGNAFYERQQYRLDIFLPCESRVEESDDVSMTLWSEAPDPIERMHGAGMGRLVLRVRSCTPTSLPQAFLRWANVARQVNESCQSFLPPNGYDTGDDAKGGTSLYLLCEGLDWGVDCAARARSGDMLVNRDLAPGDARLLFKRAQRRKRLDGPPAKRLRGVVGKIVPSPRRDGLNANLCARYNQTGQPAKGERIVAARDFRHWDNGKGRAMGQYVRRPLFIGRVTLAPGDFATAIQHFEHALSGPENRGESKHLLTQQRGRLLGLSAESCPTVGGDLASLPYLGVGLTQCDLREWRHVALEPTSFPAESLAGGEGKNPHPSPAPAGARRWRLEIALAHSRRCANRGSAEGDR
jgi:hypothetical protein